MPFGLDPKYLFPKNPQVESFTWFDADFTWFSTTQNQSTESEDRISWLEANFTWN